MFDDATRTIDDFRDPNVGKEVVENSKVAFMIENLLYRQSTLYSMFQFFIFATLFCPRGVPLIFLSISEPRGERSPCTGWLCTPRLS